MCKAVKDMLDDSKTEGKLITLIELVQEDSLSKVLKRQLPRPI